MTVPATFDSEPALATLVRRLLDGERQRTIGTAIWRAAPCRPQPPSSRCRLRLANGYALASVWQPFVSAGTAWLVRHQNPDGGWGDTVRSRSNISTTAIVWATLSRIAEADRGRSRAVGRSGAWLRRAAGDITPEALRAAILRRYGKDRTFSVPILTVLALAGKLGDDARAAGDRFRSCRSSWRRFPTPGFSTCGCRS